MRHPAVLHPLRLLALAVACALPALGQAADAVQIPSTPTSLVSTADRMISYRMQDHMWQTEDGATHVVINRGPGRRGLSLTLYSTYDGGASWLDTGISLPGSNGSSSSDGYLAAGRLHMTYDVGTSEVRYAEIDYDATARRWTLGLQETAYAAQEAAALTPAVAADATGRQWLAFTHQDKATGNFSVRMLLRPAAGQAWADTGFVFGPVDNLANERSGRPIRTSRGMGLVFTVGLTTYWAERNERWTNDQAWARAVIYEKEITPNDPYGTHFSVVGDGSGNMHMASVDGGRLVYSRYLESQKQWFTRYIMTDDQKTSYVQATLAGDNVLLIANSFTNGSIYQSSDLGATFERTHALTHPVPDENQTYNRPRLEAPAVSTSPVPVLQQWQDGRRQRAIFFAVPVVSVPVP
jgi:hypothetical protein